MRGPAESPCRSARGRDPQSARELSRIDALAAQRSAVADLIKALGGGWNGLAVKG